MAVLVSSQVLLGFRLFLFLVDGFELLQELLVSIGFPVHLFLLVTDLLSLLQNIFTDFSQVLDVLLDLVTFLFFHF